MRYVKMTRVSKTKGVGMVQYRNRDSGNASYTIYALLCRPTVAAPRRRYFPEPDPEPGAKVNKEINDDASNV